MNTSAMVGILFADKTVKSIWVLRDGQPNRLGATLHDQYASSEYAHTMIDMGYAEILAGTDHLVPRGPHGRVFDQREEGCAVFYPSNANTKADEFGSVEDFLLQADKVVQWTYLWVVERKAWYGSKVINTWYTIPKLIQEYPNG